MKKIVFCLLATASMMLFSQTTNAQINLEHTFEGSVRFSNTISSIVPYYTSDLGDVDFYITYMDANQIKLYNIDYSLYKSINLPAGYVVMYAAFFTKELFSNDNKIEFIAHICKEEGDGEKIIICNEDGMILKEFVNGYEPFFSYIYKVNGQFKLSMYNDNNNTTEIYSLPGTMSNAVPQTGSNIFQLPYPNPANSTITLPYQLKQGEISTMRIYNMNGQLIETKQIDSAFDKILLNVSNYRKGMYIYEVNGESKRFIVK